MIELENVTKLYGTVIGVNDMTLSLGGGAYGLLGPNGSGKTTLLNLITGQLRPTIGRVRVFGESPWNRDQLLRRIGLCPAVEMQHRHVTGHEWVRYLVELHGFPPAESAKMAEAALERVRISYAMHRAMGTYSLGMRQRVKLAQAFAHDPELLILDEPFNGLDPIGRHEMTELLRDWIRQGKSLILASHVLHEVEAISPSFLLINGGRLLASSSADEVHLMLADVPNEIRIRSNAPAALARRIVEMAQVDSVTFPGDESLVISTRHPLPIYEGLPQWIADTGITIIEMRAAEDSLHNLFTALMRMHRGET